MTKNVSSVPPATTTLMAATGRALEAEGWTRIAPRHPSQGLSIAAWTSQDGTVRLMLTAARDEPPMADLTGQRTPQCPALAGWSLCISDPSEAQILAAARAATNPQRNGVLQLAESFVTAGWVLEPTAVSPDVLLRLSRPDGTRTLIRIDGGGDQPGGWVLDSAGLRADATADVPIDVLMALAVSDPLV